ncbi:unnamed protein product [Symbiodinium microadriaticum]|nr:unnamed protein product [Symbiodinium microadriaticum]
MEEDLEKRQVVKYFDGGEDLQQTERVKRIEDHLNELTGKLEKLDHHLEHALASVQDHIANMIGKLEKREDKSEGRIGSLEEEIKKHVDGSVQERVNRLEQQLNGNMNRKVKGMENQLNSKITNLESSAGKDTGSWKIPFLIIVILIIGAAIGMFFFYKQLLKKHIL